MSQAEGRGRGGPIRGSRGVAGRGVAGRGGAGRGGVGRGGVGQAGAGQAGAGQGGVGQEGVGQAGAGRGRRLESGDSSRASSERSEPSQDENTLSALIARDMNNPNLVFINEDDIVGAAKKFKDWNELFTIVSRNLDSGDYNIYCKACERIYYRTKTERMVRHSLHCNCDEDAALNLQNEFKEYMKNKTLRVSERAGNFNRAIDNAELNNLVAKFIGANSLPLTVVNSPSFKALISHVNKNVKLPSLYAFRKTIIPSVACKIFEARLDKLSHEPDHSLTVEFDAWTNKKNQGILGIVLTNRNGHSTLVELIDISSQKHTAEFLTEQVIGALDLLPIGMEKCNSIISDEASACKKARKLIIDEDNYCHLIEHRCLAHVANLIGSSFSDEPEIKEILTNLTKLINAITKLQPLVAKISAEGGNRIKRPVATRWYSTCAAINSFLDIETILKEIPNEEIYHPSRWKYIVIQQQFWDDLRALKLFFDRLSGVIGLSECYDSCLANSVGALLDYGRFLLKELPEHTRFISPARYSFLLHFMKLDHSLLLTAYALDPSNQMRWLTNSTKKMIEQHILKLMYDVTDPKDSACLAALDEFRSLSSDVQRNLPVITDLYDYWDKQNTYNNLKIPAKRLAACPPSSANTERIFSTLNHIFSARRNHLSLQTVFDLATINLSERVSKSKAKFKNLPAAENPTVEEICDDDIGGFASEMYILEPSPELSDELPAFEGFDDSLLNLSIKFDELIDYDQIVPHTPPPIDNAPKRRSTDKARDLYERLQRPPAP